MSPLKKTPGQMRNFVLSLLLLAGAHQAHALQVLETGDEGATLHANFSRDDMTRLTIQDARITSMHFPEGALTVVKDDEQGYALIRARDDKPVSLVLTSSSGQTHSIYLTPTTMGMDTILIKERKVPTKSSPGTEGARANAQDKSVKRLMLAMARQETDLQDFLVEPANTDLDLWRETHFRLLDKYTGPDMVGYRFVLTNVSGTQVRLGEQEFYKHGVVAIAIDRHVLAPGEKTHVFVIMVRNNG